MCYHQLSQEWSPLALTFMVGADGPAVIYRISCWQGQAFHYCWAQHSQKTLGCSETHLFHRAGQRRKHLFVCQLHIGCTYFQFYCLNPTEQATETFGTELKGSEEKVEGWRQKYKKREYSMDLCSHVSQFSLDRKTLICFVHSTKTFTQDCHWQMCWTHSVGLFMKQFIPQK